MVFDPFDEEFFKRFFRQLREFDKEFREMEKKFRLDFREFEREPGVAGFKIEIRDFGKGKPEVRVTRIGGPPKKVTPIELERPVKPERLAPPEKAREIKPISRMLETNVGKIERLDEVVLTVQAPGVKKEDIEFRQMGNTLEIIARKPNNEAYFATFELPRDALLDKREVELKGDMLIISVPRRRKPPAGVR
jgi:HSP20 family molecular chaperone IbpA